MVRIEIFANKSVQDDITNVLENLIPDFCYTLIPVVHGKGKTDYKLGTSVWPEQNFMLITYLENSDAEKAVITIENIKKKFSQEGIKIYKINI